MDPRALSALGGKHELAVDELDDLGGRLLGREAGSLAVTAAAALRGDRRHIELVVTRAQRDAMGRPLVARRLADERDHLRAFDRAQVVDDSLGVRLFRTDLV